MFERNKIDTHCEKGTISAKITLDDGRQLTGKFVIPINKSIFDILNGSGGFIEFEAFNGEAELIAKRALRSVKLLSVPRSENLQAKLRSLDGFNPHNILGVARGASREEIHSAYLKLARIYHPDRYSTAQLPDEISSYLSTMARRINAAYDALETQYIDSKKGRHPRNTAIFTSPSRR